MNAPAVCMHLQWACCHGLCAQVHAAVRPNCQQVMMWVSTGAFSSKRWCVHNEEPAPCSPVNPMQATAQKQARTQSTLQVPQCRPSEAVSLLYDIYVQGRCQSYEQPTQPVTIASPRAGGPCLLYSVPCHKQPPEADHTAMRLLGTPICRCQRQTALPTKPPGTALSTPGCCFRTHVAWPVQPGGFLEFATWVGVAPFEQRELQQPTNHLGRSHHQVQFPPILLALPSQHLCARLCPSCPSCPLQPAECLCREHPLAASFAARCLPAGCWLGRLPQCRLPQLPSAGCLPALPGWQSGPGSSRQMLARRRQLAAVWVAAAVQPCRCISSAGAPCDRVIWLASTPLRNRQVMQLEAS